MRAVLRSAMAALLTLSIALITGAGVITTTFAAGGTPAAQAESNGVGSTPAMGWSSWSFVRHNPTTQTIEAQANAMKSSGLAAVGYHYVNVDDFWYVCPGKQGPAVDQYGRWVIDTSKFPDQNGVNGIQATANYVHGQGLQFGLYMTPGISAQAVAQNTPIAGTPYHADDIAEPNVSENNYNCGGMVGIDYSKPGAQAFINSWADQFASWGIDYLKLDGVGSWDIPDVQAWSNALRQTGRPIHLELSNSLSISDASTWQQYSNGWRTGGDIECYCGPNGSSYPLTQWSSVASRFNQVAAWQPYGGPGAFNDYDSIEVGNGSNDGLTLNERMTQMSLWALAASPFILGTDLTALDPTDLGLLKNTDVIAVDQDAIDASRISNQPTSQIFAKTEPGGAVDVGLFNTGTTPEVIPTSASALGLPAGTDYAVKDLWTHQTTETAGRIAPDVPAHGVALYRVTPLANPTTAPPNATFSMSGPTSLVGGQPATFTESFTNNGDVAAQDIRFAPPTPGSGAGWTVSPTSATTYPAVETGQTVSSTYAVTAPPPTGLFTPNTLTANVSYSWPGKTVQTLSTTDPVTTSPPVQAPFHTYSSASDAPASFAQSGQQFGISGAGTDIWTNADDYSTIYRPGSVSAPSTIDTEVASQQNLSGYGKAGIIVRNDMTGSGTTPEGVTLLDSPTSGIQLQWDDNGGTYIDSVTPANGQIPYTVPVYLKLQRTSATSYTGYWSPDPSLGWYTVGTATVPAQAATQDAGMFVSSHATGSPATVVFNGFSVTSGATPPRPGPTPYEAESPANTLGGGAVVASCSTCSGGEKVGYIGNGGTLTFNNVNVATSGTYDLVVAYCDGSTATGTPGRSFDISSDGSSPVTVTDTSTDSFNTVGTVTVPLHLQAGANTVEISNPTNWAPDVDRILVPVSPE